ncbi:MAG: hypothetical protein WDM70_03830 [Nitrosomonadales bacterium]
MNATKQQVLKVLLQTIRSSGVTVLLIEHDVRLILGLCDRVAVLDYGKKIAEDTPEEVRRNPARDCRLSGWRGSMNLLEVENLKVQLRRNSSAERRQSGGSPWRIGCAHRQQRRGQDHHA